MAHALECSVEELFGGGTTEATKSGPEWAWLPREEPRRYWEAEVRGRRLLFPAESLALNAIPHDGIWRGAYVREPGRDVAENSLVLACCDPAAGLLATEYARSSGFRLIVFSRSGGEAVNLLKQGLVHVAGLHRSTKEQPGRNAETVRSQLGEGFRLVRVADWQEGLAVGGKTRSRSPASVARGVRRWALREQGSAARECLEELRPEAPGRTVHSHTAVAEAIRGGWAEAGVCVRLAAEEACLSFPLLLPLPLILTFPNPLIPLPLARLPLARLPLPLLPLPLLPILPLLSLQPLILLIPPLLTLTFVSLILPRIPLFPRGFNEVLHRPIG